MIAAERPLPACRNVDLDPSAEIGPEIGLLLEEVLSGDWSEAQVAFRGVERRVPRLVRCHGRSRAGRGRLRRPDVGAYQLEIPSRGALDNLELRAADPRPPGPGEVQIRVQATGLNFRDVLNALGMYPGDAGPLGSECAGTVSALGEGVEGFEVGDPVVGLTQRGFCSFANAKADLTVLKPACLSAEQAASIPIAFLTAHYSLIHEGRMGAGERVLIHAAAGGVGMAAVQLARRAGAEIFATAGSPAKREFLRSLGVQHVMDSRSLDFADQVMEATGGRGVDLLLNSLTGEFIPKSLSVLAPGGRFLEIGKGGIWDPAQVAEVRPDVDYRVIFVGEACEREPALVRSVLGEIVRDLEAGDLEPLPIRTFTIEKTEEAFRFMAQAKHIGKVVVVDREGHSSDSTLLRSDASYLVTGGLGGLGLTVARWMVSRGARHLILVGRSAPSERAADAIREMESEGTRVIVARGDVSQRDDVRAVLSWIDPSTPLRGIVHAAGVIEDGTLLRQTRESFARVMAPKIDGALNLHSLTAEAELEFFVMFSAGAALLGSPGQGNYAAANAFLDALAHDRRASGQPALSINWGPWAEVGMAAAVDSRERERWSAQGLSLIPPDLGVRALELALGQHAAQVAVLPMDWSEFLKPYPISGEPSLLTEIAREVRSRSGGPRRQASPDPFRRRLDRAGARDRRALLLQHVGDQITRVLGLDPSKKLKKTQGLSDLGMDSLMAVELSNRLGESLQCSLPSTLAFECPTIEALSEHLAMEVLGWELVASSPTEEDRDARAQAMMRDEVEDLADDQVEATLAEELDSAGY